MTLEQRAWICSQLSFTDSTQYADLINSVKTTDNTLTFLYQLLTIRGGVWQGKKLEILSVRTDHPSIDGPNGHNGGNAVDFAPIVDDADEHFINDVRACSAAKGIGLGGLYQKFAPEYGPVSKCFADNATDHIHVQVVGY